ncbi:Hypothetical predicted protein [Mytilus galloprovincialis]|uniref:Reverse transcriptase domain-containing protein n=1 Tax=Mytilus galloprovincialis TaxID=29158 RepID=A0A8B6BRK7_MYTGA|nr:Hypothetical predicted protein [Mytilus galloprovincialis]
METFKSALELVKNKNFFAKLDIKDAYYSLGIKKEDRKFLRFTWKGQLYQFTAMPNGLSPAPRIFTKLLKPVLSSLRKEGYVNCAYIDDILLVGDTYEECLNNVQETMKLFDSLGFTIHKEKSVVVPAQNIEFLGFSIDSVSMVVKLAPKKVANIPPDRKIESDSSMLGYGALDVTNNLTLSGVWSLSERNKHINFLELKAAFLALKAFCCRTRNEHCDQCSVTENLSGKSNRISHSTFIFNTALVSAATTNDLRSTIYFAKSGNDSDESQNKSNSSFEKHEIGGFQDLRNKMCEGGVSAEAADIIINSWRDSTKKQYGTYIKKWLLFCDKEKTDRFDHM